MTTDLYPNDTYDPFGAIIPEDAMLPIGRWTKGRILEYCSRAESIDKDAIPKLEAIKLPDLQNLTLRYVTTCISDRHPDLGPLPTKFYKLNVQEINSMFGGL